MLPNLATLVSAAAALLAVLALIWLAARGARFAGFAARPGTGRTLRAVDSIALDSRRRLHLVACQDRQVLLLTGGVTDLVLGWLPAPAKATPRNCRIAQSDHDAGRYAVSVAQKWSEKFWASPKASPHSEPSP